eukprot:CAMPEP_0197847088 /NCGR_PEP_ID=MMETSP1438-20131217/5193_1 /TAXON_ID=1461541 /ORGANISM="Pterosperma sp., Strain CCMP1384" /LENGTH=228 /DNA_ID=CAMNT_0043458905 /DNA_START=102 /DNA_END=788 /DNA_ORIENTATION=-
MQGTLNLKQGLVPNKVAVGQELKQRVSAPVLARKKLAVRADFSSGIQIRPYTVRQGDVLYTIAKKRGLGTDEICTLNPGLVPDAIVPGQTILLPAGKFSSRDLEILQGVNTGSKVRTYPVRPGENIEAIIEARGVTKEEVTKLNPKLNLDKLEGGEKLLLPAGKYTVREKEILGTVMPGEALTATPATNSMGLIGAGFLVLLAVGAFFAYQSEDFQDRLKEIRSKFEE